MPTARRATRATRATGVQSVSIRFGGAGWNRLAEPTWEDPLDSSYSQRMGGGWNAPGAFPVLYFNHGLATAHLQVLHKLAGLPYGPEDLDPDEQHDLVDVWVPVRENYLDCLSDAGLTAVGLPASYPRHRNGRLVSHLYCQPVGQRAWDDGRPGIAARSAAMAATRENTELAFLDRPGDERPIVTDRLRFPDWWWAT